MLYQLSFLFEMFFFWYMVKLEWVRQIFIKNECLILVIFCIRRNEENFRTIISKVVKVDMEILSKLWQNLKFSSFFSEHSNQDAYFFLVYSTHLFNNPNWCHLFLVVFNHSCKHHAEYMHIINDSHLHSSPHRNNLV